MLAGTGIPCVILEQNVDTVREEQVIHSPDDAFRFAPGDTVVLAGDDDALAAARPIFVAERPVPEAT